MESNFISCGQCKYFAEIGFANWGQCIAPYPGWIGNNSSNDVWKTENHPENYAKHCSLFEKETEE